MNFLSKSIGLNELMYRKMPCSFSKIHNPIYVIIVKSNIKFENKA